MRNENGSRASASVEVFGKQVLPNSYQSYGTDTYGASFGMGMPLSEGLSTQWRYSLYNQDLVLAPSLMGCYPPANPPPGCTSVGEASLPIRQAAANGPAWVSSIGNTVAYDGLPPDKTNQGSALINVARNLGGSIGISLANVVLVQREQFHQSRLVENTTPSSPMFHSTVQQLTHYFTSHGASASDAAGQAMALIGQMSQTQATMLAYIDVFYVCAIAAAVMIPLVLVLVRRINIRASAAAVGH